MRGKSKTRLHTAVVAGVWVLLYFEDWVCGVSLGTTALLDAMRPRKSRE